jgi:hypothetical protein
MSAISEIVEGISNKRGNQAVACRAFSRPLIYSDLLVVL